MAGVAGEGVGTGAGRHHDREAQRPIVVGPKCRTVKPVKPSSWKYRMKSRPDREDAASVVAALGSSGRTRAGYNHRVSVPLSLRTRPFANTLCPVGQAVISVFVSRGRPEHEVGMMNNAGGSCFFDVSQGRLCTTPLGCLLEHPRKPRLRGSVQVKRRERETPSSTDRRPSRNFASSSPMLWTVSSARRHRGYTAVPAAMST